MNAVGILLAAGRGRRFDPLGLRNKLLQPLAQGDPVVVASARTLLSILPRVIAVVPPQDGGVADALRALGCEVTLCEQADSGMAASLVAAIAHSLPQADGWLVALGDMPYVAPSTLRALLAALEEGGGIAAPVFEGRRGNPVAFGARHLPALLALTGEHGARSLLKSAPVVEVVVNDPGILRDIDTPADLAQDGGKAVHPP
jgi:molybdenum cofactor cytidylyltransferase